MSLRVCGGVIQKNDAIMGSAEFVLEEHNVPSLIVMGNEGNDVIAAAVAHAMKKSGRTIDTDISRLGLLEATEGKKMSSLLEALMRPVDDALEQAPHGSFEDICDAAVKLNVWKSIETLLTISCSIAERVRDG
eukprot:5131203-Pleurochrysis_carterae.AAC.1